MNLSDLLSPGPLSREWGEICEVPCEARSGKNEGIDPDEESDRSPIVGGPTTEHPGIVPEHRKSNRPNGVVCGVRPIGMA